MVKDSVSPDEIRFINVLSAYGHGRMVEEGEQIFKSMNHKYDVQPEIEHYACMGNLGSLRKQRNLSGVCRLNLMGSYGEHCFGPVACILVKKLVNLLLATCTNWKKTILLCIRCYVRYMVNTKCVA